MKNECVFCNSYNKGVEMGCCSTFVCRDCYSGDGFEKSGGGIIADAKQIKCPADNVWVDLR